MSAETISEDERTAPRPLPVTKRGNRTRATLIAAARTVFERDGYLDARLTDITAEAKCSTGSFYTYFDNKEEIFAAVLEQATDEMLHPGEPHIDTESDASSADEGASGQRHPWHSVEASNRAYFTSYQRNAKLMRLLEQVAQIDPAFRAVRQKRSQDFVARNARGIEKLQREGIADPGIDAQMAARALSSMVSRLAYGEFALGELTDFDLLVTTTTQLWCNALKIAPPEK